MTAPSSKFLLALAGLILALRVRHASGSRLLRDLSIWLRAGAARRPRWRDR